LKRPLKKDGPKMQSKTNANSYGSFLSNPPILPFSVSTGVLNQRKFVHFQATVLAEKSWRIFFIFLPPSSLFGGVGHTLSQSGLHIFLTPPPPFLASFPFFSEAKQLAAGSLVPCALPVFGREA